MRDKTPSAEKPLHWVGGSKRDLMAMPHAVIRHIGTALSVADVDLIERRLKAAKTEYETQYGPVK